jgi:hypothetical protein
LSIAPLYIAGFFRKTPSIKQISALYSDYLKNCWLGLYLFLEYCLG